MKLFTPKRLVVGIFVLMLAATTSFNTRAAYADDGATLDELINDANQQNQQQPSANTQSGTTGDPASGIGSIMPDSNISIDQPGQAIDTIVNGLDHSQEQSPVVSKFVENASYWTGVAIQILVYLITAGMAISKVIDIAYIAIPPLRKTLANGYMGNPGAAGTQNTNQPQMNGAMPSMMPSMGGGYGMPRYSQQQMTPGITGMQDNSMAMQNQPSRGRIQFVSNAALNAVATESVLGTNGKGQSAFKLYWTDVVVSTVVTGILLILCMTGTTMKLGFKLGELVISFISKLTS